MKRVYPVSKLFFANFLVILLTCLFFALSRGYVLCVIFFFVVFLSSRNFNCHVSKLFSSNLGKLFVITRLSCFCLVSVCTCNY